MDERSSLIDHLIGVPSEDGFAVGRRPACRRDAMMVVVPPESLAAELFKFSLVVSNYCLTVWASFHPDNETLQLCAYFSPWVEMTAKDWMQSCRVPQRQVMGYLVGEFLLLVLTFFLGYQFYGDEELKSVVILVATSLFFIVLHMRFAGLLKKMINEESPDIFQAYYCNFLFEKRKYLQGVYYCSSVGFLFPHLWKSVHFFLDIWYFFIPPLVSELRYCFEGRTLVVASYSLSLFRGLVAFLCAALVVFTNDILDQLAPKDEIIKQFELLRVGGLAVWALCVVWANFTAEKLFRPLKNSVSECSLVPFSLSDHAVSQPLPLSLNDSYYGSSNGIFWKTNNKDRSVSSHSLLSQSSSSHSCDFS